MDLLCESKVCRVDIWRPGSDLVSPCKLSSAQQTLESLQVDARVQLGLIKRYMTSSISRTIGLQKVFAEEFANEERSSIAEKVHRISIA